MNELDLLEPSKLFNNELKQKHHKNVEAYFDELVLKSGIDKEKNKEICSNYYKQNAKIKALEKTLSKLKSKKGFFIFLLVFSLLVAIAGLFVGIYGIIQKLDSVIIIISFVVFVLFIVLFAFSIKWKKDANTKIQDMNQVIAKEKVVLNDLLQDAYSSMQGLNNLYQDNIAATLFSKTLPLIKMDKYFDISRYEMMIKQYNFVPDDDQNTSTLFVQSGTILGNPFFFEKTFNMTMMNHVYTGSLVITWVTHHTDSKGNSYSRTHTQTLTATVTKPRPEYFANTRLIYANKAAPNLIFSRSPSTYSTMEKSKLEKYVEKHEKDLYQLAEKELGKGKTYTPLGNSEFEFVFGGLNRNNEVEYRLLFTPLTQKAMLDLLETSKPYGDDFNFSKKYCINTIRSKHSNMFNMFSEPSNFFHFDYEVARDNFIKYNDEYFQSVFYDFAPLLSVPLYQQFKAREYIYQGTINSNMTPYEHESLANRFDPKQFANKDTKTQVILKTSFSGKKNDVDIVEVTAHSFDETPMTSYVPVLGGDGKMHNVPVNWYQYDPLVHKSIIATSIIGGDNLKYRSIQLNNNGFSSDDAVYERGLFSCLTKENNFNSNIASLKDKMSKD